MVPRDVDPSPWSNPPLLIAWQAILNSLGDRGQQHFVVEWLAEIGGRTGCQALRMCRRLVVAGDDDDRQLRTCTQEMLLHLQARQSWHLQIEHDTVDTVGLPPVEEFLAGREGLRRQPRRAEKAV